MNNKNILSVILVLFAVVGCTTDASLTPEATNSDTVQDISLDPLSSPETFYATPAVVEILPPNFTLYGESAVLEKGSGWDSVIVSPGAIVFHEGLFHMLYQGIDGINYGTPLESIGYAASTDGYEWVRAMDEPIQFIAKPEFELYYLSVSSLLMGNDGNWVLYFSATSGLQNFTSWFIGRATAPEIAGPWTIDDAPVLLPGNLASWDDGGIRNPQVFKTQTGFMMFFDGRHGDVGSREPTQIGMATSPDGIIWTKYDDPDTIGRRHEESDPVFKVGPDSTWDFTDVQLGGVIRTQREWVMLYVGTLMKEMRQTSQLGYATSLDGISWERYEGNPILNLEEFIPSYRVGSLVWLYHQGKHMLYFGAPHLSLNFTEIYLATSQ